jgi:glycosyltransferase involved in cell wall biosynthesis
MNSGVTVVIPAYHAERFIARAIQSVLDQPGIDPEIIVVVDGLVDRTADIARSFPKTRVVINEVNQGAPAARNRGLALAQAPYVMFLDADDWGRRTPPARPCRGARRVSG